MVMRISSDFSPEGKRKQGNCETDHRLGRIKHGGGWMEKVPRG
jgi:hypothetical protein